MSSSIQNIIVVVGLILVLGLGYYLYSANKDSVLSGSTSVVNSQIAIESADFIRRLDELKTLTLDDSIFSDARFRSFVDRRKPVLQEVVGRNNPFIKSE